MAKKVENYRRLNFVGMLKNISNKMVSTTSQLDLYSLKQTIQVLRVGVQVKDKEGLHALSQIESILDDRIMGSGKFRMYKTVKQTSKELADLDAEIERLKRKE